MIEIKLLDKNNQELTNGDTIRFVEIRPTYDSPFSDNSYKFQDGIVAKFVEFRVDAQADIDEGVYSASLIFITQKNICLRYVACQKKLRMKNLWKIVLIISVPN